MFVIDPGHGGSNLGARAAVGDIYEKEVTLSLARHVQREFARTYPSARVVLTRGDDRYVTLRARSAMASEAQATAFVSLHLNASPDRNRRGFELYVYRSGPMLPVADSAPGLAGEILTSLRQRGLASLSHQMADTLAEHLGTARGGVRNRGTRSAPLDVLREAAVPAVLVEAGYIDHAEEGPELLDPKEQQEVAVGIARGLMEFHQKRSPLIAARLSSR